MNTNHEIGMSALVTRRGLLSGAAGALAAAGLWRAGAAQGGQASPGKAPSRRVVVNGRIRQSVCQWCFTSPKSPKPMTLEELAREAAAMGIESVELVEPKDWPILKRYGLICALTSSHGFEKGFNNEANHDWCIAKLKESIDATAAAGFPSVITFSGFSNGIPSDVGLENTIEGLKKVIGYAEKKKVNLVLEVLNTRVAEEMKGHPGYMADKVEWAVEVCKRIASERMKLLFDIYHVQIMQGDLIARIGQYHPYIGHYHTAGVPGRNEIDDSQEINYPAVMRAIVATGYQGYVGQEFIPTRDPLASLREAVKICDV
jgi:hydroxypyruvate isomerase